MKTILLLAALVMSSVPVKADDTRLFHRSTVVGALAFTECLVRKGEITEKQAKELMNEYVSENPELNAAYSWSLTSDKVSKAVQALVPHMNSECDEINLSEEELNQLIKPYLD